MLVPAHLIDGWSFEPEFEFASIKFSIRQSQPPERLKEGRVVNPPEAAPAVTHCRKTLYASSADVSSTGTPFRLSQSAGSSGGEWSFRFLAGNDQKEQKTGH